MCRTHRTPCWVSSIHPLLPPRKDSVAWPAFACSFHLDWRVSQLPPLPPLLRAMVSFHTPTYGAAQICTSESLTGLGTGVRVQPDGRILSPPTTLGCPSLHPPTALSCPTRKCKREMQKIVSHPGNALHRKACLGPLSCLSSQVKAHFTFPVSFFMIKLFQCRYCCPAMVSIVFHCC